MKLLLATRNRHKTAEISGLFADSGVELVGLDAFPDIPETVEDGRTLEENACKKAVSPALASGLWTLADDTGLEVQALGGAPGVYSARYAGPGCDYAANNEKLLRELAGVEPERRKAVFRCVAALASPQGQVRIREGRMPGAIVANPSGSGGFGYDPLFLPDGCAKTFAELSFDEKNAISHRARAVRAIREVLSSLAGGA